MPTCARIAVAGLAAIAIGATGCGPAKAAKPPSSYPAAVQAAHQFMAAYQAGNSAHLRALTNPAGEVLERPGDLGRLSHLTWGGSWTDNTSYSDTIRPDVYVVFHADTTGSPDGTIPPSNDWAWGLELARRTPHSPWLVVDEGLG